MAQIKRSHKHTEADPKKHDAYTKKRVALNKRKFRGGGGVGGGGLMIMCRFVWKQGTASTEQERINWPKVQS